MTPSRRKKWTEAEEKTLIQRYGEMVSDGTLAKLRTREKKYKPIALHVNYVHHVSDPITYPWQWTWKDVSTKVQNMRHQYLLVKQKIKKVGVVECSGGGERNSNGDEFDWFEGVTYWSNFLLYKEVFGDVPMTYGSNGGGNGSELMGVLNGHKENGMGSLVVGGEIEIGEYDDFAAAGGENGILDLDFDYEGEEGEENCNCDEKIREEGKEKVTGEGDDACMNKEVDVNLSKLKKKRKVLKGLEKKVLRFLSEQLGKVKETEARFEQLEAEREQQRQRRETIRFEREIEREQELEEKEKEREEREKTREKLRRQSCQGWEAMEERERRRRREELIQEKEWEEMMDRRRLEWKKRIDGMLNQHQEEMTQLRTRVLHDQQNLTSQFIGIVSQWTAHSATLSDHTTASHHYLSQMMQNLHHVNGMVHEDARVEDTQDDQFIVDG